MDTVNLVCVRHACTAAGLGVQEALRKAAEVFALVWAGSQVSGKPLTEQFGRVC